MNNDMHRNEISDVSEERRYFLSVLSTFQSYRKQSLLRLKNKEDCLKSLPLHHQKWLSQYKKDIQALKKCIEKNYEFIPIVVKHAHNIFHEEELTHSEIDVGTLDEGLDKVQSVFKQLMRDWSSLGAEERKQCYDPVINEIELQYPEHELNRANISVLVPGTGLGRLAFEIARRGFTCQGNEFNLFMLIVSYYVINECKIVDEFTIYPWIHQYCNNISAEVQMTSVRFPDVKPMPTPGNQFSMIAGDFLEVYRDSNEWDCVATCFFIDCAANVVQFIETIHHILKPDGLWINLGPLLYHYSDIKNQPSIEPSFEVLCNIIEQVGFKMEKCEVGVKTRYCQNPKSMLQSEYNSIFFVCRKIFRNNEENPIETDDNIIEDTSFDDTTTENKVNDDNMS